MQRPKFVRSLSVETTDGLLPQRALGSQGLMVSAQGLGCMGMTAFYGDFSRTDTEATSLQTITEGLKLGMNFLDTAWIYQSFGAGGGNFINEELIGKAIKQHGRSSFIIATKFGIIPGPNGITVSGSEETIRSQLDDSLRRLGTDYIDLYYIHRIDIAIPIEETMSVLKSLVDKGTIKYIGLSECTSEELRKAHLIHPITAIQMEWSLQSRDAESTVIATARELGVGIVCYSPLGRGLLSKTFNSSADLDAGDWRLKQPRFEGETCTTNSKNLSKFHQIAERKGCTSAQLALSWLHSQGKDIFPIPGTKTPSRLIENLEAIKISLDKDTIKEIEESVPVAIGDRYAGNNGTFNERL